MSEGGGVVFIGPITPGHGATWAALNVLQDSGSAPPATGAGGGLIGVTNGSDAAPGIVGEYISSEILRTAPLALTTGVNANLTTIALTAGDWQMTGEIAIQVIAGTMTQCSGGISLVSVTNPPFPGKGLVGLAQGISVINGEFPISVAGRLSLAAPATVFVVVAAIFTGTGTMYGFVGARRAR